MKLGHKACNLVIVIMRSLWYFFSYAFIINLVVGLIFRNVHPSPFIATVMGYPLTLIKVVEWPVNIYAFVVDFSTEDRFLSLGTLSSSANKKWPSTTLHNTAESGFKHQSVNQSIKQFVCYKNVRFFLVVTTNSFQFKNKTYKGRELCR